MGNVKFYIVTLLLVVGAGILGYAAINSLRDPVYYVNNQKLATVGDMTSGSENILDEKNDGNSLDSTGVISTSATTPQAPVIIDEPKNTTSGTTPVSTGKNSELVVRLQKILDSKVVLKKGDSGDQVKAVQEALNIVVKAGLPTTGTGVGNFGPGTETAVKDFQKAQKISPESGQVATKTLEKLIEKLK
jgi:peptidoglycan hydrolase-like protein with peptidoglycan-binding domain